jgi:hypothetical protein
LQGISEGVRATGGVNLVELEDPFAEAATFLAQYSYAKIIFIVDTHCLDNGFFVYKGESAANYQDCSLLEVSAYFPPHSS